MTGEKGPRLSARLSAAEQMVRKGSVAADIGTDHAHLPIRLCLDGICPSAIAMDVREGPLEGAMAHIRENHLEDVIEVRLSDGLEKLETGEASCAVFTGMGGLLICRLLNAYPEKTASLPDLVLSPQSDLAAVRLLLKRLSFRIAEEEMLLEDGKYYTLIRAENCRYYGGRPSPMTGEELLYGPCLIRNAHPVLKQYLEKRERVCRQILQSLENARTESREERLHEVEEELRLIEKSRRCMYHADERDTEQT